MDISWEDEWTEAQAQGMRYLNEKYVCGIKLYRIEIGLLLTIYILENIKILFNTWIQAFAKQFPGFLRKVNA